MSIEFDQNASRQKIDADGSPISLVRVDPKAVYSNIYSLLQSYINDHNQSAWEELTKKADTLYRNMTLLLDTLEEETPFKQQILSQLAKGKKLLVKANGVSLDIIDETTHGAGPGAPVCSSWLFVAALMRYFHDCLNISYYQMCFGEASTTDELFAKKFSMLTGRTISKESILEGKNGGFYGGFGFYFARKYLSDRHPSNHTDDPMNGYETSVKGEYLPPGRAKDQLMVYDLNNIYSSERGRTIPVPDGANYKEVTIHKAVIGGDDGERDDYPGCVLINTPILKMHAQDLLTNAIKNMGIGLFPSYCVDKDNKTFKYSHHTNFKSKLPHSPWVMELDETTLLPITDTLGNYRRTKTLGFSGTQCDIIRAIQEQATLILTVCDAIHIVNISHNPDGAAIPVPEGFLLSSFDPLALDYCCARYCFNQLPMMTGNELKKSNHWPTGFVQEVPLPYIKDNAIHTTTGYDSPLFRYPFYDYAEKRGIGQKNYYVTGFDTLTNTPIASVHGHLGRIEEEYFIEFITKTMYYNPDTFLHHLQATVLSYAKCCDTLTGTSLYEEFMILYDENKDGVIDYDEKGRGFDNAQLAYLSKLYQTGFSKQSSLKRNAQIFRYYLKYSRSDWNAEQIDFMRESLMVRIANQAYELSKLETSYPDFFFSALSFGQGMWPSWQTASYLYYTGMVFGSYRSDQIRLDSIYGYAFQYADLTMNDSQYTAMETPIQNYFTDIASNKKHLPFTLYVPNGWSKLQGATIPNVVETDDREKIFTILFEEVW